jgi:hypothetical protein
MARCIPLFPRSRTFIGALFLMVLATAHARAKDAPSSPLEHPDIQLEPGRSRLPDSNTALRARERRTTFVVTISAGLAMLSLLGLVLRKRNRQTRAVGKDTREVSRPPANHGRPAVRGRPPLVCPSCGKRYAGKTVFCAKDGTELVLLN